CLHLHVPGKVWETGDEFIEDTREQGLRVEKCPELLEGGMEMMVAHCVKPPDSLLEFVPQMLNKVGVHQIPPIARTAGTAAARTLLPCVLPAGTGSCGRLIGCCTCSPGR